jgi:endonuclease III
MPAFDALVDRLTAFYGVLPSPPSDAFGVYVWEVLSAQTTPHRRDAAFAAFRRIPALTPDAIRRAPRGSIEAAVTLAGPHVDRRLEGLNAGADVFRRHPELPATLRGPLSGARRALTCLPQLDDAGRRRILLFAAGHLVLPVDPGIGRVVARLAAGNGHDGSRRLARLTLSTHLSREVDAYRRAAIYLGHHAGGTCAESAPHCGVCPLLADCAYGAVHTAARGAKI